MTNDLARAVMSTADDMPSAQMRFGTVTQVSPLLVTVGAATVGMPCSRGGSYTPAVGDYVIVLVQGADRVAIGLATTTAALSNIPAARFNEATGSAWTNATTVLSDVTASVGSAPTITAALNTAHRYRAVFIVNALSTAANDRCLFSMFENGVARATFRQALIIANAQLTCHLEYVFIPASASSVVYKIQGRPVLGTGTLSLSVSATDPMQFYLEDLGVTT